MPSCLRSLGSFSQLAWVLPDGLLRAGVGGGEAMLLRLYNSFLLRPRLFPTPLPHILGCQGTTGNSYPVCTPVLLPFLCEVCQLCANDAEALSSGLRVEVDKRAKGGEVKAKVISILPLFLSLYLNTEGPPFFLSALVLVI